MAASKVLSGFLLSRGNLFGLKSVLNLEVPCILLSAVAASSSYASGSALYPPVVMCGPSGSGKSTLIKALLDRQPERFSLCVSHTTRRPRSGEIDGVHYYFVEHQEMWEAIERGDFLEYAEFAGHLYGTSRRALIVCASQGKICLLDLDVHGVRQMRKRRDLHYPRYVFVKPPSLAELERRLRERNSDSTESIQRRLARALPDLEFGESPGNFDAIIVNDNLEHAVEQLTTVIDGFCESARRAAEENAAKAKAAVRAGEADAWI